MKLKRVLITFSAVAVMASTVAISASAAGTPDVVASAEISASTDVTIEPRIEVIETKYRKTTDGRLQYRRWNATHGYWVDPEWIDIV